MSYLAYSPIDIMQASAIIQAVLNYNRRCRWSWRLSAMKLSNRFGVWTAKSFQLLRHSLRSLFPMLSGNQGTSNHTYIRHIKARNSLQTAHSDRQSWQSHSILLASALDMLTRGQRPAAARQQWCSCERNTAWVQSSCCKPASHVHSMPLLTSDTEQHMVLKAGSWSSTPGPS